MKTNEESEGLLERLFATGAERERAFFEIYDEHSPSILNWSRDYHFDDETRADVLQETMVRFYKSVRDGTFTKEGNLRTFLYHLWRYAAADAVRRRIKVASVDANLKHMADVLKDTEVGHRWKEISEQCIANDIFAAFRGMRNDLSGDERLVADAIIKAYPDYCTCAEVVELTGLNLNRVKRGRRRIREKLRKLISREQQKDLFP